MKVGAGDWSVKTLAFKGVPRARANLHHLQRPSPGLQLITNNLCIFSPRRGRPSSTSQGWRWSTRCPRRSTFPRNRIRSRWSLERCSLLQGEAGNELLVSLLTSTRPRRRGTSRCRACSPPPTCRCSHLPGAREVPHPEPHPRHPHPLWLHLPKVCDGGAGHVRQRLCRLSSTCANLSHPAQTIWRLRTPLPPLVQLQWDQLAETWRCIELCPSHIEALMCTRAYQRHNKTKGFPSLCKPLPILDLLQGRRGRTIPRPTKCRMESRLRTSLMII